MDTDGCRWMPMFADPSAALGERNHDCWVMSAEWWMSGHNQRARGWYYQRPLVLLSCRRSVGFKFDPSYSTKLRTQLSALKGLMLGVWGTIDNSKSEIEIIITDFSWALGPISCSSCDIFQILLSGIGNLPWVWVKFGSYDMQWCIRLQVDVNDFGRYWNTLRTWGNTR